MDNWLIFQYCVQTELWGRRGKVRAGNEETGPRRGLIGRQIPRWKVRADGETVKVGSSRSHCQEKPLSFCTYPYRKPTQVDEERILRPTGEALSRNSAK